MTAVWRSVCRAVWQVQGRYNVHVHMCHLSPGCITCDEAQAISSTAASFTSITYGGLLLLGTDVMLQLQIFTICSADPNVGSGSVELEEYELFAPLYIQPWPRLPLAPSIMTTI